MYLHCFFRYLKKQNLRVFLSVSVVLMSCSVSAQLDLLRDAPIAFVGHGALFDQNGNELSPSAELVRKAQAFYREKLISIANEDQRTRFQKIETELTQGLTIEGQTSLVVDSKLIGWLIREMPDEGLERLAGINSRLESLLNTELPESSDVDAPPVREPFLLPQELKERIIDTGLDADESAGTVSSVVTNTSGAAYQELCRNSGVPIPPDWGTPGWINRGLLNDVFIGAERQAEVFTFESTNPAGMCYALPRFSGDTIQLLGIICLGKVSAKACFWDNLGFEPRRNETVSFSRFSGGADLGASGVCTDCHAGENPFIIHPGTTLDITAFGLPGFADKWYEPIVKASWPQNPGPTSLLESISLGSGDGSCLSCHAKDGPGGRFPELSEDLLGYCRSVLGPATRRTMPLGNPGNPAFSKHVDALLSACNRTPVWVDFSHTGDQKGTNSEPFSRLADGVDKASSSGGLVQIKPGTTDETIIIRKRVDLKAVGGSATIGQ